MRLPQLIVLAFILGSVSLSAQNLEMDSLLRLGLGRDLLRRVRDRLAGVAEFTIKISRLPG